MKFLKYCTFAVLAVLMMSCSGNSIVPVSENIQGPLAEYFEVVTKDYKVKDGKVYVEIKRIKDGFPEPWQEGMKIGYSDGEMEPQFTAEFLDADGNVLSTAETSTISDREQLNTIAALGVGETASLQFSVPEGARQFKLGSTFKVNGEIEATVNISGNIGKYPVKMTMHIAPNSEVTGAYYYERMGAGNYLYLKGRKDGDKITLDEYNEDGVHTGKFAGTYAGNTYSGKFNADSGEHQFVLTPDFQMETIDLSLVDFSRFNRGGFTDNVSSRSYSEPQSSDFDDSDYESQGSEDWDSVLDSYDSYVSQYISLMKKAEAGDMEALAEYPSLLKKAQELDSKLGSAQGEMSAAQCARYMRINQKLMNAAMATMP